MKKYFVFMMAAAAMIMAGCEDDETIGGGGNAPVKAAVTGVTIDPTSLVKMVGQWEMLAYTVHPANAGNKAVTWTSSNTAVVEVDNMGDIIARSIGTSTITITTAEGNFTATCEITVNPFVGTPVTGVTLNVNRLDIEMARKIRLVATLEPSNATIRSLIWESDDENVASITNGVVEGIGPGTATITVTTTDGDFTAECTVTVSEDFLIEDFEAYAIGDPIETYKLGSDGAGKVSVVLEPKDDQDGPAGIRADGPGKVGFVHGSVVNGTYGDMGSMRLAPLFEVQLPEGKKLRDYSSVTFDAYVYRGKDTDSQGRTLGDADSGCGWYGGGTTIRINDVQGGTSTNLRVRGALTFPNASPSTEGGEWNTRVWARGIKLNLDELDADKFASDLADLNSFTLVFGTSSGYAVYCIDNVVMRKK